MSTSTRRKPNSYKPGSTRTVHPEILPMPFDIRLAHYAVHPAHVANQLGSGLSGRQNRRLISKELHDHVVEAAG
jgi:hypothetical protein